MFKPFNIKRNLLFRAIVIKLTRFYGGWSFELDIICNKI